MSVLAQCPGPGAEGELVDLEYHVLHRSDDSAESLKGWNLSRRQMCVLAQEAVPDAAEESAEGLEGRVGVHRCEGRLLEDEAEKEVPEKKNAGKENPEKEDHEKREKEDLQKMDPQKMDPRKKEPEMSTHF